MLIIVPLVLLNLFMIMDMEISTYMSCATAEGRNDFEESSFIGYYHKGSP